jgi:microcystin-dependent protein
MSEPFLGEIKIISWNFPPKGWAFCNGQLLPINQNQALFSILGTTYGGDGMRTFGLPNLQGRVPMHVGSGIVLGELAGEAAHTLITPEIAAHTHSLAALNAAAATVANGGDLPSGNVVPAMGTAAPNATVVNIYGSPPSTAMSTTALSVTGGSQPHENMSPYLVLNMVIALQGIFPSQN